MTSLYVVLYQVAWVTKYTIIIILYFAVIFRTPRAVQLECNQSAKFRDLSFCGKTFVFISKCIFVGVVMKNIVIFIATGLGGRP